MSKPHAATDLSGPVLVEFALRRPKFVTLGVLALVLVSVVAALGFEINTDPEDMLPANNEVRVRNEEMRESFGTRDVVVVGFVDDEGIATPEKLAAVAELRVEIEGFAGVVPEEIVSFGSAVEGEADLSDQAAVDALVVMVSSNPLLAGNVLSSDGTTAALFVPLVDKSDANSVAADINAAIDDNSGLVELDSYVAGLPLAEEAFGQQMFVQMAVFAPLAGLLIFLLMWWFFRRVRLVIAAMAVAMVSVVWTMGALIGTGHTLQIMTSMLPIFLMPIAILDSVHVLSEFYDRYPQHLDRRQTLRTVYAELYRPLTYTSLTTAVAFASLAVTPIPPVRTFGIFVAIGVFAAWLLTVMLIPALIMLFDENRIAAASATHPESSDPVIAVAVRRLGQIAVGHRVLIGIVFVVLALGAVPAIAKIQVNDNPVNWFKSGSDVRVATEVLNERLPGTFNANLLLVGSDAAALVDAETVLVVKGLQEEWAATGIVGASASYADFVVTDATEESAGMPEVLMTSSGEQANIRLQLNDGDNQAMREIVDVTDDYLSVNPLPQAVSMEWAGESYLNLVWQDEMVSGMLQAFASTLLLVTLFMVALFRSIRWALLSVIPVLWTVLVVYGALGFFGKDYDMPIAVLSTLALGIGVDFAIHFIQRFREYEDEFGDRRAALRAFFEEPARALTRNALIIAVGFTPLFLSSLVPYIVVAALLSSIILLSWLATLLVLPAAVAGPSDVSVQTDKELPNAT